MGGVIALHNMQHIQKENDQMIFKFLGMQKNASLIRLDEEWGFETKFGRQILPGTNNSDGFYYSKLEKHEKCLKWLHQYQKS